MAGEILNLESLSRYRRTRVFSDEEILPDGRPFFGTWRSPEIVLRRPPSFRVLQADEITRPDLLAFRTYGNPNLFWAIAVTNNIMLPMRDMRVGQNVVIPHVEDVLGALNQAFSNSTGTT